MKKDDSIIEECEREIMSLRRDIQEGSVWRHVRSGKRYIVKGIVLREKNLKPDVLYKSVFSSRGGIIWSRPASEFLDGRFVFISESIENG